ncbi:MAG: magnesium transporter CorA family protein, partial [Chloroflexia bacterium]
MHRTLLRDEANQFRVVEDLSAISDIVLHKDRYLWLDLEKPTPEDFKLIHEELGLHPLAIEDAMSRHQRPKVDQYDNFYLVVFYAVGIDDPAGNGSKPGRRGLKGTRFLRPTGSDSHDMLTYFPHVEEGADPRGSEMSPTTIGSGESIVLNEVTMFMGQNYLVTVHDHPVKEIEEAARRWRQNVEIIGINNKLKNVVPGTRTLTAAENKGLKPQPGDDMGSTVAPADGDDKETKPEPPKEKPLFLRPGQLSDPAQSGRQNGNADGASDIGILLYSLLDTIVDNYFPVMDSIVDRIEVLEEQIFERYSQDSIESIFALKKDLLALRKVFAPERDVLNVLTRSDIPIFDRHTLAYLQDVYDHLVRVTDSIDTYRDLLSSALDSFLSMQSNRLNSTVQTLTSFSLILMSIAAITGWYGMNFAAMPELTSRFGYPGVFVTIITVVSLEILFFKRKRWL